MIDLKLPWRWDNDNGYIYNNVNSVVGHANHTAANRIITCVNAMAEFEEPENDPSDDLECAFCSMLWNIKELRSQFIPESVVPFITDAVLQNIVSALLTGEIPEQLEARWRQMDDMKGLNLIAKGNGILEREGLNEAKAELIAETLRKRCIESRDAMLKSKMTKGIATEAEQQEHLKLTRILKGGKFGI